MLAKMTIHPQNVLAEKFRTNILKGRKGEARKERRRKFSWVWLRRNYLHIFQNARLGVWRWVVPFLH